jgi:hypothetical protein
MAVFVGAMTKQTRALTADEQSIVLAALYAFHQRWEQRGPDTRGYAHRIHKVMNLIEPGSTLTVRHIPNGDDYVQSLARSLGTKASTD